MSKRSISREKYISQLPAVHRFLTLYPTTNPLELASVIAVATGCPIIIVCQYIGELSGFTPELVSKMERLCLFYNVAEVIK